MFPFWSRLRLGMITNRKPKKIRSIPRWRHSLFGATATSPHQALQFSKRTTTLHCTVNLEIQTFPQCSMILNLDWSWLILINNWCWSMLFNASWHLDILGNTWKVGRFILTQGSSFSSMEHCHLCCQAPTGNFWPRHSERHPRWDVIRALFLWRLWYVCHHVCGHRVSELTVSFWSVTLWQNQTKIPPHRLWP